MQVTPEERSLAAAMRWQDELASRGCLPAPETALTPLVSLANFDSSQLARLQRSDSKLLFAAAAAAQARATPPTSSLSVTEDLKTLDRVEEIIQSNQASTSYHNQCGTPLRIVKTDYPPSMKAENDCPQASAVHVDVTSQQSQGIAEAALGNMQRQSAPEVAQLARLPSSKGHCLVSYPSARPQSPMKHPSAQGAPLQASEVLSVRPFGVQPQRPSTAAASLDAAAVQAVASTNRPAEEYGSHDGSPKLTMVRSEDRPPAVLKRCSRPTSEPLCGPTVGQTSHSAADDIGTVAAVSQ